MLPRLRRAVGREHPTFATALLDPTLRRVRSVELDPDMQMRSEWVGDHVERLGMQKRAAAFRSLVEKDPPG